MKSFNEYPTLEHRVNFRQTETWYSGNWQDISKWCDEVIGPNDWSFYNSFFVFNTEHQKLMFLLKWGSR